MEHIYSRGTDLSVLVPHLFLYTGVSLIRTDPELHWLSLGGLDVKWIVHGSIFRVLKFIELEKSMKSHRTCRNNMLFIYMVFYLQKHRLWCFT